MVCTILGFVRERAPGLIQHVLTVLVFWSWVLLLQHRLPPSSWSLTQSSSALAFCFMGPWTFAWICCPQLPYHSCKNSGEYNILFLGSILVISSQDSSALGCREFTQEGAMTISPFATQRRNKRTTMAKRKKCCRRLVPSSDFFVQSCAVPTSFYSTRWGTR